MDEWILNRLPTEEDIEINNSPYFLCVVRFSSTPKRVAFNVLDGKWYEKWEGTHFINEETVMAWRFMPVFDYNEIKTNSKIFKE